jgi:hypothetical protein
LDLIAAATARKSPVALQTRVGIATELVAVGGQLQRTEVMARCRGLRRPPREPGLRAKRAHNAIDLDSHEA